MFYRIVISPMVYVIEKVYLAIYSLTSDYGLSLILLSLLTSFIIMSLNRLLSIYTIRERQIQQILAPQISRIKSESTGIERHTRIKNLYNRYSYVPIYSFRTIIPLLVQLPFLLAAYFMLDNLAVLKNVPFLFIQDLGSPDHLLGNINLLPILMTVINLSATLLLRLAKRETIQASLIALLFLILLYNAPSALLIFWTTNNLIFFLDTLKKRMLKSGSFDSTNQEAEEQITFKTKIFEFVKILNQGHFKIISLMIVFSLIVWILIPMQLLVFYDKNLVLDISFFTKTSIGLFFLFSIGMMLIYFLIYWIINILFPKKPTLIFQSTASGILIFIICWVTLSGYVFPLIKTTGGMVDDINLPTNCINILIVFIISSCITSFSYFRKGTKFILIGFVTFYLVVLPGSIKTLAHFYSIRGSDNENLRVASQLSSNRNLLVISFDGIPGHIVNDIFANDPLMRTEFKDFIHYSNAISTAPATDASMATELFGNIDLKDISDNTEGLFEKLPFENLLMNMNYGEGVSISTFGDYNIFNKNQGIALNNITPKNILYKIIDLLKLYRSELSRLLTGKISGNLYVHVINLINKQLVAKYPYLNHKGPSWDRESILNDEDYHWLIASMQKNDNTDTLVIKYFHFLHTHYPVDFDMNGKYKSDDETWHKSNQNYNGLYGQTYYALEQFSELIKKLQELKVYDNTFLVLKSDHGAPTSYFTSYPYNLRINGQDTWGYSRYLPLLMIKDIGRRESSMVDIPDLVSLGDLACTISTRFQRDGHNKNLYPGVNLLEEIRTETSPDIYLDIVKNAQSTFQYNTQISIKIDRRKSNSLIDLLKSNDSVRLSTE